MKIYAFSDEAASGLSEQIAAMKRNGLDGTEIRGVNGRNITALTVQEAAETLRQLKDNGLCVWSVGSPIGKIPLDGDYAGHLELLRHTLELANTLECANLRMFSFYLPEGAKPESCRNEVIEKLAQMAEIAADFGVALCHENEKGIYGDLAVRCAGLLDAVPALRCVFDPANFIQCGQDVPEAWKLLGPRTWYMHIKDAMADGTVVPAGQGIGHLPEILADYAARGGEAVTIEPHLRVFDGLRELERGQKTALQEGVYPTEDAAFDAACGALRKLI
ncbi:MAG: sugar phosphate isomerase/epimerase [Clostridia bacterium]|nr:sugar phosphate isomerase/epimerase [Clostridia bacterium]